jgi:hypothetical protein
MSAAFEWWPRRDSKQRSKATVGDRISLDEQLEYVLTFSSECKSEVIRNLEQMGAEFVTNDSCVLSFRNFVGHASVAGVDIEIVSQKLGNQGTSRLLDEVSNLASSLLFGRGSPSAFKVVGDRTRRMPVPYHQLQFLRRVMLTHATGMRLQDWLLAIERNPTQCFKSEMPLLRIGQIIRIDGRTVESIFSHPTRLAALPLRSALRNTRLATMLTTPGSAQPFFPEKVATRRGRLSYDTVENRFTKHVLNECLALLHRFLNHPQIHSSLRDDCRKMLAILAPSLESPFFSEVGRSLAIGAQSQALIKCEGYRQLFAFYRDLIEHVSLPPTAIETARFLEGRDVATLYEYWVFLKSLEISCTVLGTSPYRAPVIHRDELGESLGFGISVEISPNVSIEFNPTFVRSKSTAYSTPLRPDVIIRAPTGLHALDAKYRLERVDTSDRDADDGDATYKRADLYKMHTYRDAIVGLKTASVVYPGSEFVFFERSGGKHGAPVNVTLLDGVGAIPLRPADPLPEATLREFLRKLLTSSSALP